jgi:hypothetical protein
MSQWQGVERLWREFSETETWPRSRCKRLFEALTRGRMATDALLSTLPAGTKLPDSGDEPTRKRGWPASGPTPYFDPLEILDFHVDCQWTQQP